MALLVIVSVAKVGSAVSQSHDRLKVQGHQLEEKLSADFKRYQALACVSLMQSRGLVLTDKAFLHKVGFTKGDRKKYLRKNDWAMEWIWYLHSDVVARSPNKREFMWALAMAKRAKEPDDIFDFYVFDVDLKVERAEYYRRPADLRQLLKDAQTNYAELISLRQSIQSELQQYCQWRHYDYFTRSKFPTNFLTADGMYSDDALARIWFSTIEPLPRSPFDGDLNDDITVRWDFVMD